MHEPLTEQQKKYWDMAGQQCEEDDGGGAPAIRFLKYLLAGFCMLVVNELGHPAGTPFHGGNSVQFTDGVYYCPVREKTNDVDAALCPFCPALQTPEMENPGPQSTRASTVSRSSLNTATNSITSTDNS